MARDFKWLFSTRCFASKELLAVQEGTAIFGEGLKSALAQKSPKKF